MTCEKGSLLASSDYLRINIEQYGSHDIEYCFDSIIKVDNFCHTEPGFLYISLYFKKPYIVASVVIVNRILITIEIVLRLDKARVYISDGKVNHTCEVMEISNQDIPVDGNIARNTHRISCGNRVGTMVGITTDYNPHGKDNPVLNLSELGVCVMPIIGKLLRCFVANLMVIV